MLQIPRRCLLFPSFAALPFQYSRGASHLAQRKPSRLVLSTKVAKSKKADSPVASLNRREAGIDLSARSKLSVRNRSNEGRERKDGTGKDKRAKGRPEFKQMKMSQSLSTISRTARTAAGTEIQSQSSFGDFDLLPTITKAIRTSALSDLDTIEPTAVQKLAIPVIKSVKVKGKQPAKGGPHTFLIAAETGSGKTLAYVLPLLDYLKRAEEDRKLLEDAAKAANVENSLALELPTADVEEFRTRPKAVILVPTSELVNQVGRLLKSLSHLVKFRSALLSREYSATIIRNRLFGSPVDLVVSTPHLLDNLTSKNPAILSECSHLVVDEADSLYDRSFSPITSALVKRTTNLKALVLCSATIPRSLETRIRDMYPDIKRLVTPNLHAIPRRVQLSLVDIELDPYRGNKNLACADTLYNIAKDGSESGYVKKVIIFVNEREKTEEVASYLRSKKIDAVAFARDTMNRQKNALLDQFTGPKELAETSQPGKQLVKVLVTTDISSRGIDTKTVKNVVLYDVPHSSVDFIHRLGRTGRMGRRGRAVVLVDKNTNKGWVKDIKRSMFMGGPLV